MLFAPLTHDEVREIAKHYLAQVTLTLAKAGKTIQVEDDALELIVTKGYNLAFGARFLKRVIDEQIKLPISARWKEGSHFASRPWDGEIVVEADAAPIWSRRRRTRSNSGTWPELKRIRPALHHANPTCVSKPSCRVGPSVRRLARC